MTSDAFAGVGWGAAGGLLVALGVTLWVLHAVLTLLRRTGRVPPGQELTLLDPNRRERAS